MTLLTATSLTPAVVPACQEALRARIISSTTLAFALSLDLRS